MGANEHGVAIGNQALRSHVPAPERKALPGMDLLRLALERASTAAEAVQVITTLLERFGQGGNCGHLTPTHYHNGFMIADPNEAFVLETVGREWLLERVRGVRAISNRYSIEREMAGTSRGLPQLIRDLQQGVEEAPGYARVLANVDREHIGNAGARLARSTHLLKRHDGALRVADMMSILRDHGSGEGDGRPFLADCADRRSLCMHAGGTDRHGQTVGSLVSELRGNDSLHWVTGTAATCISIFKPVLMDGPLPVQGPRLTDRFDARALWWRHERMHRTAVLGDFAKFVEDVSAERDAMEERFRQCIREVRNGGTTAERSRVVADCWRQAMETEDRWCRQLARARSTRVDDAARAWERMNKLAGVDVHAVEKE
jgi:secernin